MFTWLLEADLDMTLTCTPWAWRPEGIYWATSFPRQPGWTGWSGTSPSSPPPGTSELWPLSRQSQADRGPLSQGGQGSMSGNQESALRLSVNQFINLNRGFAQEWGVCPNFYFPQFLEWKQIKQTHNQGLCQLILWVSWDIRSALRLTGVLVYLQVRRQCIRAWAYESPWSAPCQIKKPFKGPRRSRGNCREEQKRKVCPD